MAQYDFGTIVPTTKSGTALATDLTAWRTAVHSTHKGPSAPAYAIAGIHWIDDTLNPIWIEKVYDGAAWIVVAVINATLDQAYPLNVGERQNFPLAGGTANALTLGPSVPMAAYTDLDVLTFEAAANNTAAVTANVSSLGLRAIRKMVAGADVALVTGDILDGLRYYMNYDSAANAGAGAWILVNPSTPSSFPLIDGWGDLILVVANQDYRIKLKLPFGGTINETVTRCTSGTATFTFKINTTALGGTANAVSSSEVTQAQASANVFVAGDDIVITASANAACVNASYMIKFTRTVP